jgi:hypothetical protein
MVSSGDYGLNFSAAVTIGVFLAGQLLGLGIWGVHIDRIANIEIARNDEFVKRLDEFARRLDELDRDGTRKLVVVEDRQNNIILRLNSIESHIGVPTP